jgi:hypothetical protein
LNNIISLVNALAWPTALVILVSLFRREIGQASGRLGRVKYRDLELTFREELRQAEVLARSLPAAPPADSMVVPAVGQPLLEAAKNEGPSLTGSMIVSAMPNEPDAKGRGMMPSDTMSPRESILAAWWELGQALIRVAAKVGDRRSPTPERADDAFRFLAKSGRLNPDEIRLYEGLAKLRDQLDRLDGASIGPDESRKFIGAASRLLSRVVSRL